MLTRIGNIYNTNAEWRGRFGNDVPKGWAKDDEQRVPLALFVVDDMPLTVGSSCSMSRDAVTNASLQIIRKILEEDEREWEHSCL